MRKSFQYRAIINKSTERNCQIWLDRCRTLYNLALEQRITVYRQSKKSLTCFDQINQLPDFKKAFPEFSQISSGATENVIKQLDGAYQSFFHRVKSGQKPGFPRFKSANRFDSFMLKDYGWKINGKYLIVRNLGRFKLFLSRPIEGKIKTVTIRRASTGKWFVSFSCDEVQPREFPAATREVGIDVGIKNLAVDSDGLITNNPSFLKASLAELRRKQRGFSHKVKGSNRRKKARLAVAKVHEKVTGQRKDFLHKLANHYVRHYNKIFVEDLNIKGMIRNRHLSRSISDSSWGLFNTLLAYKAAEAGREVVKIHPNGTSQFCSGCGEKVPKLLSVRIHSCPYCGLVLDRDHNAALNILQAGARLSGDNVGAVMPSVA